MNKRLIFIVCTIAVVGVFFYQVFLKGFIPFPGDLLLSEYQPWRTYSYNGMVPGSIPNKAQYFDTLRQLYPWKTQVVDSLKKFQLPLWNPYSFSGSPLAANNQSAVFYPLNFLYLVLPQPIAWAILVMLQPLLAMVFTYLFARKISLSWMASTITAISFAWCMYMTVFLEYNTLGHYLYLLPMALYFLEDTLEKRSTKGTMLFTATLVFAAFAGHLQLFLGLIVYIFLYAAARILLAGNSLRSTVTKLIPIITCVFIALILAGVQLIPTLELISLSARSSHSAEEIIQKLLIAPYQLIMFLIPDLFGNPASRNYLLDIAYPTKAIYIGFIPFFFVFLSLPYIKKNFYIKLFFFMAVSVGLFTIHNPIGNILYRLNIPIVSTSSPSNLLFLLSFSLSILAGFGLDALASSKVKTRYLLLGAFWLVCAGTLILSKLTHTVILKNNFIYSLLLLTAITAGITIYTRWKKFKTIILCLFIGITVIDLAYFLWKFNPFVPVAYVYPATSIGTWLQENSGIDRFWGYGTASVQSNFSTQLKTYSPDGYDPLYPRRYGAFIQTSEKGIIPPAFTNQTRSDATIVSGYGPTDMVDNTYRLKVLKILGVKYILDKTENGSSEQTFPSKLFTPAAAFDGWTVYRYIDAAPRAFLATSYALYKTDNEFTQKFFDTAFDPGATLLLEDKPDLDLSASDSAGTVEMLSYAPSHAAFKTESENNALLFLSDTYYPGWNAYIDGKQVRLLRADYTFRAVEVPKGAHQVEFRYTPKSFYFGFISTIIGLGSLITYWIVRRMKK